jgi:hypothetical protein
MINGRILALSGWVPILAVVFATLAQAGQANDGTITAHREDVPAPSVERAVRIGGRWHAAEESNLRGRQPG